MATAVQSSPVPHGHPAWRAAALTAVVAALAALGAAERVELRASVRSLAHPEWWWLAAAVGAEVASMAALAAMQRRLLAVAGSRLRARSATAVVYASNAISGTVPVAGAEMATAYSYRRYQRLGADRVATAWMIVVSGLVSSVTFAVVVAAGALASGNDAAVAAGAGGTVMLAVAVAAVLAGWGRPRSRAWMQARAVDAVVAWHRLGRRPTIAPAQAGALVEAAIGRVEAYRLRRRDWAWVGGAGLLNWCADAACLALALRAVGAHVPWAAIGLVWAAGAGAGTLRVTPGGIGTVEPAMVAALVGTGLAPALGLTAVLAYRLVSFWGMVIIGWSVQAAAQLRSGVRPNPSVPSARIEAASPPAEPPAVSMAPELPAATGDPIPAPALVSAVVGMAACAGR